MESESGYFSLGTEGELKFLIIFFYWRFYVVSRSNEKRECRKSRPKLLNYGVLCKVHKNPQSLTVMSLLPTNLLYIKKIDSYKKGLRESKKKEMPCFYRYLYNPSQQRNRKLWKVVDYVGN